MTANLKTCQFNVEEIKFFGVILSKDGIRTDPEMVKAVESLQAPRNRAELRKYVRIDNIFFQIYNKLCHKSRTFEKALMRKGTMELDRKT